MCLTSVSCRRRITLWLALLKLERLRRQQKLRVLLYLSWRRKQKHRIWIHEINQRRKQQGDFDNLLKELRDDDERFFCVSICSVPFAVDTLGHGVPFFAVGTPCRHAVSVLPRPRGTTTVELWHKIQWNTCQQMASLAFRFLQNCIFK